MTPQERADLEHLKALALTYASHENRDIRQMAAATLAYVGERLRDV